mgnify:CR=1 FL=1
MQIYYFSWIRERVGTNSEEIKTTASTLQELVNELVAKGDNYASAFSDLDKVKVAVDQIFITDFKHPIKMAKEIAFFPPVTGG